MTDLDGKIKIDNLSIGKYYILEKEPATGYVLTEEKVFFEIKKKFKDPRRCQIIKSVENFKVDVFLHG